MIHIDNIYQAAIFITYGIYGIIREEGLRISNNKNALSVLSNQSTIIAKLVDSEKALFNSFYNDSNEIQTSSIKKLVLLENIQYIITAHYGFTEHAAFPN